MDRPGEPDLQGIAQDFREHREESRFQLAPLRCSNCPAQITWAERNWSQDRLGKALCRPCQYSYKINNNYDIP